MQSGVASVEVIKYRDGIEPHPDLIAVEEPLQIRIGFGAEESREEVDLVVTMRTPGHDLELAAGFLMTEGIVSDLRDIMHLDHCNKDLRPEEQGNVVRVELSPSCCFDIKNHNRSFTSTASCGVCGVNSIRQIQKDLPKIEANTFRVDASLITNLPEIITSSQVNYSHTGGIHAAALTDGAGNIIFCREDIGRHNAVDKVIGAMSLSGTFPIMENLLFLSGRAGFELIQKAVMAGIPLVAAVGAPSNLAVKLAKALGLTLLGFVRNGNFNIYCGEERILR